MYMAELLEFELSNWKELETILSVPKRTKKKRLFEQFVKVKKVLFLGSFYPLRETFVSSL